jgi:hypothetical protein
MGYILQMFEYKCAFIHMIISVHSVTQTALCLALSTTAHCTMPGPQYHCTLHYAWPSVPLHIYLKFILVSCNTGGTTVLPCYISPGANVASAKQRTWVQQFIVPQPQPKVLVKQAGRSVKVIPPITEQEWNQ